MADTTLSAASPLDGYTQRIGDTEIREVTTLDIVAIAVSAAKKASLDGVLHKKVGLSLPIAGTIERNGGSIALLGLQSDQCFMVTHTERHDPGYNPVTALRKLIGNDAYLTDQSDSWVILELEGPSAERALERICPVDISAAVFGSQNVARTSMEHLSVIVERPDEYLFRLYSPRSSANSFLHAVTESLHNVSATSTR